ncbi:hypothetical protein J3A83DRAFT_4368529 [Scleroderma citrinum]
MHACNGALVSQKVAFSHEWADLHGSMLSSQAQFQRVGPKILVAAQPDIRPVSCSFPFPNHEQPPLSPPNLDFWGLSAPDVQDPMPEIDLNLSLDLPDLAPKIPNPGGLLAALNYYLDYNAVSVANACPLMSYNAYSLPTDPEQHAFKHQINCMMEAIQMDIECEEPNFNHDGPFSGLAASPTENDFTDVPSHLIVIYALVSWLHLQFHLPQVACNVLLGIFALILTAVSPVITTPFLTLQSSNCVLGMDKPIHILTVCPSCQDVYPPAGLPYIQEKCTRCKVDLFLDDKTQHGNIWTNKTPVVKYPYIPLSEQITSILKIPGTEALLDGWRDKSWVPGEYQDIFDGAMCHEKLKGPDGKLFFFNKPNECQGPNNELRIGVNMGVDW